MKPVKEILKFNLTIIEIMIVVTIIGFLATCSIVDYVKGRAQSLASASDNHQQETTVSEVK